MHQNGSSAVRRLSRGVALAVTAFSLAAGMLAPAAQAQEEAGTAAMPTRQEIVNATNWNLVNPRGYKTSSSSPIYQSTPNTTASPRYNYLGRNGSNANRNIYNGYNGQEWCGHFARFMWTLGGAKPHANVPKSYASSQAWRTEVGSRFKPYSVSRLPQPGDVLVWTNNGSTSSGHVAVVTYVNTAKRAITYIGGNEGIAGNSDSVVQHSVMWSNIDTVMSGKQFRGFASLT